MGEDISEWNGWEVSTNFWKMQADWEVVKDVDVYVCVCVRVLMHVCTLSHVWLFETPLTIAHQALLSVKFSRQEYWSGLTFVTLGDLLDPGIEPTPLASPVLKVDSLLLCHLGNGVAKECID